MDTHQTNVPSQRLASEVGVIVLALVLPTCVTLLYFVVLATAPPQIQLLGYASKVFQFALPLLWVVVLRREQGFWPHNGTTSGVAFGAVFGILVSVATLGLYYFVLKPYGWMDGAITVIQGKVVGFGVDRFAEYMLMAIFYSVMHSLLEEYYWRWFVFGRMRLVSSLRTAVIVSSLGFMAHHVLVLGYFFGATNPLTYLLSISVAVGGAVWAVLYQRTDNLLGAWISHFLVDAAIFAVGFDIVGNQIG